MLSFLVLNMLKTKYGEFWRKYLEFIAELVAVCFKVIQHK